MKHFVAAGRNANKVRQDFRLRQGRHYSRADLPTTINTVIATGMAIDPAERYSTASAVTQAAAMAIGELPADDREIPQLSAAAANNRHSDVEDVAPTDLA